MVTRLKRIDGVEVLSLSTNATQLQHFAHDLRRAGLDRLNVSLDSLSRHGIEKITGFDAKAKVMAGLQAASDAGFVNTKINMVPLQGINDSEIDDMVAFCIKHQFILRLIELMPMGASAQQHQHLDLQPIIARISEQFQLIPSQKTYGGGPARYWQSQDGNFSMGYITPMSQHFCQTCNRVRMAVDGTLYMCLGQEHQYALAPLLKKNVSDADLQAAIQAAIHLKPLQHTFNEEPKKIVRIMSMTGG